MIKIGLLGSGFMGSTHAGAWNQLPDARVITVAGSPLDSARRVSGGSGARTTENLDEVLAAPDVDAVDVCLPTHLHEEYVVKALRAGKHVLCEKPLALSLESADRMLGVAREMGRILMPAQVVRFWPQYRAARDIVCSGKIGKVKALRASRTSRQPGWAPWFLDPEKSGGALFDLGIHDLDYTVWLFGKPRRLNALGFRSERGSWDYVSTLLDYRDEGPIVQLETGYFMPDAYPFSTELRIVGERGLLEYDFRVAGNIESRGASSSCLTLISDAGVEYPPVPETDGYVEEIRHFVECVRAGRFSDLVPIREVRWVLQTVEAIKRSLETGREIHLAETETESRRRDDDE